MDSFEPTGTESEASEPTESQIYGVEEPPAESPPQPPGSRNRMLWVIIAIAVGIIVVLAALFVGGIGPFSRSSNSSSPSSQDVTDGQTYAQAIAATNQTATSYGPGPWNPIFAVGADPSVPVLENTTLPSNEFSGLAAGSCNGRSLNSTSIAEFPGYDGNLSNGEAPTWLVVDMNATGTMLWNLVLAGVSIPVELYTGPGCAEFELLGTLPSGTVDSSNAAAAALSAGGYAFEHEHPGGSTTFGVSDLGGNGGWVLDYSTCPVVGNASAKSTYFDYRANVSILSGAVVGTPSEGVTTCGTGLQLALPLSGIDGQASTSRNIVGWGPPISHYVNFNSTISVTQPGEYSYTTKVTSSDGALVWSDLIFAVDNSTGQSPSGTGSDLVEIKAPSGCIIADGLTNAVFYGAPLFGGGCTGSLNGGASVDVGDTVSIMNLQNITGLGYTFDVYGAGSFWGNYSFAMP